MRLNFGILKRPKSTIPGFGLTLGYTVFYLSIIVIIPLIALFTEAFSMGWQAFLDATTNDRVIASYKLTQIVDNCKYIFKSSENITTIFTTQSFYKFCCNSFFRNII